MDLRIGCRVNHNFCHDLFLLVSIFFDKRHAYVGVFEMKRGFNYHFNRIEASYGGKILESG
jgi:hypothetical protein